MNRSFNKYQTLRYFDCSAVEVKSKFGAEFRRFCLDRYKPGKFEDFYKLILHIHHISSMEVMIGYADVHGDLLPINNDDNFFKAVSSANPLLRVFIQRQGQRWEEHAGGTTTALWPIGQSEETAVTWAGLGRSVSSKLHQGLL
uniref:Par-6 family cell polarity regulator gamma n=1 Tax=Chelydra serpentina TaxID=8475 RepID=A0A8C3RYB7_CHESE